MQKKGRQKPRQTYEKSLKFRNAEYIAVPNKCKIDKLEVKRFKKLFVET